MKKLMFVLTLAFGLSITSCTDPCKDITCSSVGTCDEGICTCDDGYTGDNCETEVRAIFFGDWQCDDYACEGGSPESITFTIEADDSSVTGISIFDKDDPEEKVPGIVSNGNIVITDHSIPSEGIVISGTVSLANDILNMSFVITENGILANCTGTATKL